jgi:hypothetical protein
MPATWPVIRLTRPSTLPRISAFMFNTYTPYRYMSNQWREVPPSPSASTGLGKCKRTCPGLSALARRAKEEGTRRKPSTKCWRTYAKKTRPSRQGRSKPSAFGPRSSASPSSDRSSRSSFVGLSTADRPGRVVYENFFPVRQLPMCVNLRRRKATRKGT